MEQKPFKILSIDGGGIRGVFPAMFLTKLEAELKAKGKDHWQVYKNFNLICGTSTGGIIAIGLALGIPASKIFQLYIGKAKEIFGEKKCLFFGQFKYSSYSRCKLEKLVRETYKKAIDEDRDPILKDCRTNICIPIYDLLHGTASVLKNNYHSRFTRDYHRPAYQAAMATSAAPTYFDPYDSTYTDLYGQEQLFSNKVDGGVFANNPTLLGIIEAQEAFNQDLSNIRVLSLGTGHQKFSDGKKSNKWGIWYWMLKNNRRRIMELFMQGQSQLVENIISLMQNGIDREREANPSFIYHRITTELNSTLDIELDETDEDKLKRLAEKASFEFSNNASRIIETFC